MKKLFLIICITSLFNAYGAQDELFLKRKIEECKSDELTSRKYLSCLFIERYIEKYFGPLCIGQGYEMRGGGTFYAKEQEAICKCIARALADEKFVTNIL